VFTSSLAAIRSFSQDDDYVFRDSDWNSWSTVEKGDPYGYAKTEAEKLVHKWASDHRGSGVAAVSVNPGVVFGPCWSKTHTKASPVIVRQLLYGNEMPADISLACVDVRDVAAAVCGASTMDLAAGDPIQRYLMVSGELSLSEIAARLKQLMPSYEIQLKLPSTPMRWFQSWFMNEYERMNTTRRLKFDGSKAATVFLAPAGYRPLETTLLDTAESMINDHGIKPPRARVE